VWPEHWAFDPSVTSHAYDPGRAAALLDAAGVRREHQPDVGRPSARFHFTCLFPENLPLWERIALLSQRNLAEIGVDMALESVPIGEFNRRLATGNFDAVLLELIIGNSASRPFTFWHSQSTQNLWGYKSPEIDQALEGIRRASTDTEYREAFRTFQNEIQTDPPAVFLALGETSRAVSKRFQVVAPRGSDILPTISDWKLGSLVEGEN
jgi:ABC-type transport system substrate-binding protein